jgi:hypothetical protein
VEARLHDGRPTPDRADLTIRERLLLFCVASSTDWQRTGVSGEIVTAMILTGHIVRDALGRLALTAASQQRLMWSNRNSMIKC